MNTSLSPEQIWTLVCIILPILIGQVIIYLRGVNNMRTRMDKLEGDFANLKTDHQTINSILADISKSIRSVELSLARIEERQRIEDRKGDK